MSATPNIDILLADPEYRHGVSRQIRVLLWDGDHSTGATLDLGDLATEVRSLKAKAAPDTREIVRSVPDGVVWAHEPDGHLYTAKAVNQIVDNAKSKREKEVTAHWMTVVERTKAECAPTPLVRGEGAS